MFKKGDIVLVPFPFTDLSSSKVRPTLVLGMSGDDVVAVFITSIKPSVKNFVIHISKSEFLKMNLKCESYVVCNKIATLDKKMILGKLGDFGSKIKEVDKEVKSFLKL